MIENVDPPRAPLEFSAGPLRVQASLAPDGKILDDFYRAYDEAFVLPNEKETRDGFRKCLAQNFGESRRKLAAEFGEFREVVLIAQETASGAPVGGANFICYPLTDGANRLISMNLNYIFVVREQRRKGYLRTLLDAVRHAARALLGDGLPVLIFFEQNDPARMDAGAYALDTRYSGMDQRQRNAIWAGLGGRIVDFPYVQPALSPGQKPDRTLLYTVLGAPAAQLSARLLREHLRRFFGISVLKGRPLDGDPDARAQLAALAQHYAAGVPIALLSPKA